MNERRVIKMEIKKLKEEIEAIADKYAANLDLKVTDRINEMASDDNSHYLIYEVLGIESEEGYMIDLYQNKGRFLYKYAGAFLEEATFLCFKYKFLDAEKVKIPNTHSPRPKTFEIDCLVNNRAYEIKWRDATTDGDHITKEHTRAQAIKEYGYTPIRIMFYYPNRKQAIRIQKTLETLYNGLEGEYYWGDDAWKYVNLATGIDLYQILVDIASKKSLKKETLNHERN